MLLMNFQPSAGSISGARTRTRPTLTKRSGRGSGPGSSVNWVTSTSGTQSGNQEHNAQLVAQIEPKSDNSGRRAEFFTRSINRLPSAIRLSPCSSRIEERTARHASVLNFLCKHTTEVDKNMSAVQKTGVSHSEHEIISTSGTLYRSYTRVRNPSGIFADMAPGIQILCFPSACSGSPEVRQCEY
jgi:hypothetical protein